MSGEKKTDGLSKVDRLELALRTEINQLREDCRMKIADGKEEALIRVRAIEARFNEIERLAEIRREKIWEIRQALLRYHKRLRELGSDNASTEDGEVLPAFRSEVERILGHRDWRTSPEPSDE